VKAGGAFSIRLTMKTSLLALLIVALSFNATAADQAAAKESASKPSIFKDMLKGKLVALNGKRVGRYEMAEEPKYYAFYFSAHWCPPCRAFTPELVKFYNAQEGKKKNFEIIFVSRDHDEKSMEDYIKGDAMPWPAIAFRSLERIKEINKYCGSGIPCFVLVDREGKVISDSYEGKTYLGPTKVMNDIPAKTAH
jgi:thiol-disulfide isomerase/thioredoxin